MKVSCPSSFPNTRLRRNRKSDWSRRLVQENTVSASDLIWPLFVLEGNKKMEPISSMPGVNRYSIDLLLREVESACKWKIPVLALFPYTDPSLRNETGSEAYNENNLMCRAIREVKLRFPEIGILCDVALDPYTSHGHDGLLQGEEILNDETVEVLIKQSLAQASAGGDIIAPSDMMDGRIGAIRHALDESGFKHVQIMSYAAKYASGFFGPFRDAIGSKGFLKGDKKTYQMNPANSEEALLEVAQDIQEGADMVMVKPGMPYLDIVHRVKETFGVPTFAYQVSGEYAMIAGAGKQGWVDYDKCIFETMLSFKRAGASGVLTYAAPDIIRILNDLK